MKLNKKYAVLMFSIFTTLSLTANASGNLSAEQIYSYAKNKNLAALKDIKNNIDIPNKSGNTALCLSLIHQDKEAYKILKDIGANPNADCISKIGMASGDEATTIATTSASTSSTAASGTFLGMGTTGWLVTGAIVAGGAGVAAAAGGGGGGGGSSSSGDNGGNDKPTITCVNGSVSGNKCICKEGWSGTTCATAKTCAYNTTSCTGGYEETGKTCKSGNTTYKECKAKTVPSGYTKNKCEKGYTQTGTFLSGTDTYYKCEANKCDGYNYSNCPSGYAPSGSCQSGKEIKYKCDNCATGYEKNYKNECVIICPQGLGRNGNGECVVKKEDIIGKTAVNNDKFQITNNEYANVYGMKNSSGEIANSSVVGQGTSDAEIAITSIGDGDVYGIFNNECASNVYAEHFKYNNNDYGSISAHGVIKIDNKGNGNIYGIYSTDSRNLFAKRDNIAAAAEIAIKNEGNGDVYGIYGNTVYNARFEASGQSTGRGLITIKNVGRGNTYGMYKATDDEHFSINAHAKGLGEINITNDSTGDAYGIYGSDSYNAYAPSITSSGSVMAAFGKISITNNKTGNAYGMYGNGDIGNARNAGLKGNTTGLIYISNNSTGNAYGMYGNWVENAATDSSYWGKSRGIINLINKSTGNAYGIYGASQVKNNNSPDDTSSLSSIIEMVNIGNGMVTGIYAKNGTIENSGDIVIHNLGNGTAVGIYADGKTSVTNSGIITVYRESYTDDKATDDTTDDTIYTASSSKGGTAIGIYGTSGSTITNSGLIIINGAKTAYGIYAESGVGVINNSLIIINDISCVGTQCGSANNAIKLNGAKLFQNGVLTVSSSMSPQSVASVASPKPASLNLNDFGGKVVASDTSQFVVEGAISGDLTMNNSIIENGFDTTYAVKDMIKAGDTSELNLVSQSALFDATLQNDKDAVMTMKSFNDVVENQSLADFLKQNYAAENNEELFGILKGQETIAALNDTINSLTGTDIFNRFTFEDLTMMRDLNADMNNTLFMNTKDHLETSGNITPWNFDGNNGSNARYALYNTEYGNKSLGLGFAFSDVRSNSGRNNKDSRYDQTFQMSVPMGYKAKGFKFITTPRFGYAYGTYDRTGYENKNYDGKIEKRMFGLMNEVRYPIALGKWSIAPSVEFNALGYHIKGREDTKEYSLNIKSQNNYSVESGIGLYANRELKLTKNSTLKLNTGLAVYHEFADPYEMELGMNGMDGSFKIRDKRRKDNRAVLRTGFDYGLGNNITIIGAFSTYMDGTTHNNANLDFKYNF